MTCPYKPVKIKMMYSSALPTKWEDVCVIIPRQQCSSQYFGNSAEVGINTGLL
jgi:hypothetical protein